MLKLTHSFCRYSRLTCESIYYNTIVRQITQLSFRRKICITWNNQQSLLSLAESTCIQWRHLAYIKKKYRFKKSHSNSFAARTHKPMSEPIQPTLIHVSHGGKFNIEDQGCSHWQKQTDNIAQPPHEIPHNFRVWESVDNGKKSNNLSVAKKLNFKVMSYNVLAQYLLECHPYLYTECSPINLNWTVRGARIFDEILSLSPDILCLQEVQVSHLNSFYNKFEQMGYFGVYKQKTGDRQDGCAIYFKPSIFYMQDHLTVEFYQPEIPILNRDNIGLMVKLAPRESPKTPLVVATTHLLYNPKRTDVRLAQLQVLLAELDRFAFNTNEKESGYLPIILTGDLNSTPDSAVIQLLDNGHVRINELRDQSDWKKIGVTDNCQHLSVYLNRKKGVNTDYSMIKIHNTEYRLNTPILQPDLPVGYNEWFNSNGIGHPFKLTSVYHKIKNNGSLEATTFQDYWVTVDYIYFSVCNSLKLVERLRLPTQEECSVLGKLPNKQYGSDHLALAATFQLRLAVPFM